jgi:hypothetical protein
MINKISIALLLSIFCSPALARQSKPIRAMNDIHSISVGIEMFKISEGQYPPQEHWEELLLGKNIGGLNKDEDTYYHEDFNDPWKNKYIYRYPGIENKDSFDLYSCGQDGISRSGGNDKDDINNWDPDHTWLYEAYGFMGGKKAVLISIILFLFVCIVLPIILVICIKTWKRQPKVKDSINGLL